MELTVNTELLDKIPVEDRNRIMAQAEAEMKDEFMIAKVYNVCGIDVIVAKTTDEMLMMKIVKDEGKK